MKQFLFLLAFFSLQASTLRAQFVTIKNGIEWTDDEGYIVQAHGGNFLQVGTKWYLIGEDRRGLRALALRRKNHHEPRPPRSPGRHTHD